MRYYAVFRDQVVEFQPMSESLEEDARSILNCLGLPVSTATFRREENANGVYFYGDVPAGDKGA